MCGIPSSCGGGETPGEGGDGTEAPVHTQLHKSSPERTSLDEQTKKM